MLSPGELVQAAVPDGDALAKVLAIERGPAQLATAGGIQLPDDGLPVQPGALEQATLPEREPLGERRAIMREVTDHGYQGQRRIRRVPGSIGWDGDRGGRGRRRRLRLAVFAAPAGDRSRAQDDVAHSI